MRINESSVGRFRARLHEMGEEVGEADAKGRFLALLSFVYLVAQTPPEDTEESPLPRSLPPIEWYRE